MPLFSVCSEIFCFNFRFLNEKREQAKEDLKGLEETVVWFYWFIFTYLHFQLKQIWDQWSDNDSSFISQTKELQTLTNLRIQFIQDITSRVKNVRRDKAGSSGSDRNRTSSYQNSDQCSDQLIVIQWICKCVFLSFC